MNFTTDAHTLIIATRMEEGLKRCVGSQKAATTDLIIRKLKKEGYEKVNGVKIRQVIHYLRTSRHLFICGDKNGYYVPANQSEAEHQIRSMKSRIREINEACNALIASHDRMFKQQQLFE